MSLLKIIFNKSIENKYKFGTYVKERRLELGIGLRDFSLSIGLAPSYVSDIEKGNRQAPLNYLNQYIEILKIDKSQINYFYDIAGCSHSNWADINDYLSKMPNARKAIRLARDKNITEKDFVKLITELKSSENLDDLVQ